MKLSDFLIKFCMTRFVHDQFAKQYLKELLATFGEVETSRDIASEVRQLDVLFYPQAEASAELSSLGLLGKLAATERGIRALSQRSATERNSQLHGETLHPAR